MCRLCRCCCSQSSHSLGILGRDGEAFVDAPRWAERRFIDWPRRLRCSWSKGGCDTAENLRERQSAAYDSLWGAGDVPVAQAPTSQWRAIYNWHRNLLGFVLHGSVYAGPTQRSLRTCRWHLLNIGLVDARALSLHRQALTSTRPRERAAYWLCAMAADICSLHLPLTRAR